MKPELQSVLIFISIMALFYFAYSFYWLTFDISHWDAEGRAMYLFIGLTVSGFASIFNLFIRYDK